MGRECRKWQNAECSGSPLVEEGNLPADCRLQIAKHWQRVEEVPLLKNRLIMEISDFLTLCPREAQNTRQNAECKRAEC